MKTYKSGSQQTVFDVALAHYGGLDSLATLIADNPELIQPNGEIEQFRVSHLVGDAGAAPSELQKAEPASSVSSRAIRQTPVYNSTTIQSVFDVALMQYGGLDGLAVLLADNKDLVQAGGTIRQFRVSHKIQARVAVDARIKRKMLALVPSSSGVENQAWATDPDTQDWITDDGTGQSWFTDTN